MNYKSLSTALGITLCIWACKTIASFDQYAYTQETSLKVEALSLMDKSADSYTLHVSDCETIVSDMLKMREYEKHRPKDVITFKMWDKLIDSTGQKGIVGSYLSKWKTDGTEKPVFILEAKKIAGQGFDLIMELESQKIKPDNASVQSFITK